MKFTKGNMVGLRSVTQLSYSKFTNLKFLFKFTNEIIHGKESMPSIQIDRKIAVIFVADVVGYSKHMEKDEDGTLKSYSECEKILNNLLEKYKGKIFNTAGDSVLAEFSSAVNAVECGAAFQNEIKKKNQLDYSDVKLEFRLGINMGDVVSKDGNLLGDGVNIAARL